ncbi:hypothetical protein MCNS_42090 [Mycobacterium conspicuum]|uniref:Uncharacterized protein n=1 Tax=Mycobacterium conspicuum TaxID=44010 RepID=A0A7I7YHA3_9MYCO|nr:hypothetical protein MCNS_42090 [Mycobacterium conspicuum]
MPVIIGAPPATPSGASLASWSWPARLAFSGWLLNGVFDVYDYPEQPWLQSLQLQTFHPWPPTADAPDPGESPGDDYVYTEVRVASMHRGWPESYGQNQW